MPTIELTNKTLDKSFIIKTQNKLITQVVYKFKKANNLLDDKGRYTWEVIPDPPTPTEHNELYDKMGSITPNKGTLKAYIYEIKRYLGAGHDLQNLEHIQSFNDSLPVSQREKFIYAIMKSHHALQSAEHIEELQQIGRKNSGLIKLRRIARLKELAAQTPKEEEDTTINYEEIRKRGNAFEGNPTYKFIASFYVMDVPWRADTVVHFTKDIKEKDKNIVRLIKKKVEMSHFKTVKSHGRKEIDISPELASLMRKQFKATGSRWLLPDPKDNDKPLNANTLIKILKTIYGTGVQGLRHAYLTHARKTLDDDKFYEICNRANTSAEMGELVYNDSR